MRRLLSTILTGALLLAAAGTARAQESPQDALKQKLADKIAEPWVKEGGWILDYDAARAEAKKSGKPIFAYFTRSYSP